MSDGLLETYQTVKVRDLPISFLFSLSYCVQHLHKIVPAFTPYLPVGILSYLAFVLLTATFGLAFYFTTYVIVVSLFCHHLTSSAASRNQQFLRVRWQWLS
jgi:uncharacterized membrane protein